MPTDDIRIHCEPQGNIVATGPTSADVPLVALYERSTWLSGFDLPSLILWADGSVVYSEQPYGKSMRLFQATISTDDAFETLRRTITRLRNAPADSELTRTTDEPSIQIIFRDGDASRVVEVYGMTRTTREDAVPDSVRVAVAAYRLLLTQRPSGHKPAASSERRPQGWPSTLPAYRGQVFVDQLTRCTRHRQ